MPALFFINDRDSRVLDTQLRMMLAEVALEKHDFKLEITSKLSRELLNKVYESSASTFAMTDQMKGSNCKRRSG